MSKLVLCLDRVEAEVKTIVIDIGLADMFGKENVRPLSEAPARPENAARIDSLADDVFEEGEFRWRYSGGKLLRAMRYAGNPRKLVALWQDDLTQ